MLTLGLEVGVVDLGYAGPQTWHLLQQLPYELTHP